MLILTRSVCAAVAIVYKHTYVFYIVKFMMTVLFSTLRLSICSKHSRVRNGEMLGNSWYDMSAMLQAS